jgi:hypothetical protein
MSWHMRMRAHRAPLELFGRLRLQADALEVAARSPVRALPILTFIAGHGPVSRVAGIIQRFGAPRQMAAGAVVGWSRAGRPIS